MRTIVLLLLFCGSVSAQLPLRPGMPNALVPTPNWRPPLQSQVGLLAGQLLLEVQQTKSLLASVNMPVGQRIAAMLTADKAISAVQQFQKTAQSTTDRGTLLQSHAMMDPPLEALERTIQQIAPGNATLATALSRMQFTDERIHAALNIGGNASGDQQRLATARLARAIEDQTMELRSMLLDLGGAGFNVSLRNLSSRAGSIVRSAETGQPISVPQEQWNQLVGSWNQLQQPLGFTVAKNPNVRYQVARIDKLIQDLGAVLRGEAIPGLPPGPGHDNGFLPRTDRLFVVGAGEGGGPHVKVFHDLTGGQSTDFFAYDPNYRGGVRVAVADLTGDGIPDVVTVPGKGHPPTVRVFNGRDLSLVVEFNAYDPPFDLGMYVAAADFSNGRALIAVGPGLGGPPHVKVFDLMQGKLIDEFYPYPKEWRCGARVALGDVNGDLIPDLITAPGPGVEPNVNIYDGRNRNLLRTIQAVERSWQGGLFVSTGDITRNGRADVLIGTDVGGPARVRAFDATNGRMIGELTPYPTQFHAGVRVALFDVNQDGVPDMVTSPGPAPIAMPLRTYDGRTRRLLTEFYPYGPAFGGGAFVASR